MIRDDQQALVVALVDRLRARGSWCGATNIQKALFMSQTMFGVPHDLEWVLYKHGPYSPPLRGTLGALCDDEYLSVTPHPGYGSHLYPTRRGERLVALNRGLVQRWASRLDVVADAMGPLKISDLEALTTAWWVTRGTDGASIEDRVVELRKLKPHITPRRAASAVESVDALHATAMEFEHETCAMRRAQARVRELTDIGLNYYDALRVAAHDMGIAQLDLIERLKAEDRFDGPAPRVA